MRQQQRMKVMKDLTKKIRAKGRMDANHSWWDSELLAGDCEKAWPPSRMGRYHAKRWYDWRRMKSRRWKKNTRRKSVK